MTPAEVEADMPVADPALPLAKENRPVRETRDARTGRCEPLWSEGEPWDRGYSPPPSWWT